MRATSTRLPLLALLALACAAGPGCGADTPAAPAGHAVQGLLPEARAHAHDPLGLLFALHADESLAALQGRVPAGETHVTDSADGLAEAAASPLGAALAAPPQAAPDEHLLKLIPRRDTAAILSAPARHLLEAVLAHVIDAEERERWDDALRELPGERSVAGVVRSLAAAARGHALLVISRDPASATDDPPDADTPAPPHVWTFLLPIEGSADGRALDEHLPVVLGRFFGEAAAAAHQGVTYTLLGPARDPRHARLRPAVARVDDVLVVTSHRERMEHLLDTHADADAHPSVLADARCAAHLRDQAAPRHAALWVDLAASGVGALDDLVVGVQRRADGLRVSVHVRTR